VKADGTQNTPIHVSRGEKKYGHDGTGGFVFCGFQQDILLKNKIGENGLYRMPGMPEGLHNWKAT
jgi:hypothetical protein